MSLEGFYSGLGRAGRPGRTRNAREPVLNPACFLAAHGVFEPTEYTGPQPMPACDGLLRRCHLIPKRMLPDDAKWDPRVWVMGCGGPMGNAGHHGALDTARTLRLPRAVLPPALEEFAAEHGLGWWLDREYGAVAPRGEGTA